MKIGGEKMRNASAQQGENERQWKEANKNKSNRGNIYDISYVRCLNKMFHVVCKTTTEKCTKKCAARAKFFFSLDLLIFCRSRSRCRLALLDFIFLFE